MKMMILLSMRVFAGMFVSILSVVKSPVAPTDGNTNCCILPLPKHQLKMLLLRKKPRDYVFTFKLNLFAFLLSVQIHDVTVQVQTFIGTVSGKISYLTIITDKR